MTETITTPAPAPVADTAAPTPVAPPTPSKPTLEQQAAAMKVTAPPPAVEVDAELEAVVDGADAPPATPADPNRPDWLLPKYQTVEEQAKAYVELQKVLGKRGTATLTPEIQPPAAERKMLDEAAFAELGQEWVANKGDLKPETYERLAKEYGVAPSIVKSGIESQFAVLQMQNAELVRAAGFQDFDQFDTAYSWWATNAGKAEVDQFTPLLNNPAPSVRGAAIRHLKASFDAAHRAATPRLAGAAAGTAHLTRFETEAEIREAMKDPRYQSSPEYRAQVDRRIEMSL